jgi:hypothetical protein
MARPGTTRKRHPLTRNQKIAVASVVATAVAALLGVGVTLLLHFLPSGGSSSIPGARTIIENNHGTIVLNQGQSAQPAAAGPSSNAPGGVPGGLPPTPPEAPRSCSTNVSLPSSSKQSVVVRMFSEAIPGSGCWSESSSLSSLPGTAEYLIGYRNTSSTEQDNVVVRLSLAPTLQLISGGTSLTNQSNPTGTSYASNGVTSSGIVIGNYNPGGGAFIKVLVATPFAADIGCGTSTFRSVAVIRPEGSNEFYNTSDLTFANGC